MFSDNVSDEEIIRHIETWIGKLADEDYVSAYNLVDHDPYYKWSPRLIEKVINGYGLPEPHPSGEVFKVTPISSALGEEPTREIERNNYKDNRIGYVMYDLPLNGKWSDLSATFRLENNEAGVKVILEEIHVL